MPLQAESGQGLPGRRRVDDDATLLLLTAARTGNESVGGADRSDPNTGAAQVPGPASLERTAFLIDLPGEDAVLLPAIDAKFLPRGQDTDDLRRRAAAAARACLRERNRLERRVRIADWLMLFVDQLREATTPHDVYRALMECGTEVIAVHDAVVYASAGDPAFLDAVAGESPGPPLPSLPVAAGCLGGRRIMTAFEVHPPNSTPASLAPLFDALAARQLVCVPVGRDALLVLAERRRNHVITAEDRDLLDWIVKQAERVLAGLRRGGQRTPP